MEYFLHDKSYRHSSRSSYIFSITYFNSLLEIVLLFFKIL